ncbi:UNVERIFIED_CONTAM: hypothetical protein B566_EDAN019011 [Ephemera danica]|nr:hypothetical protein B566_EDAN019011 [Ephemera danica]
MIEHYKQPDPVGLPGAPIPDPVDVPDMKHSFAINSLHFKKQKVHGLSKFRFQHIRADLAKLEMAVGVRIETLLITGEYTFGGWFSKSSGPFTVNMTGVNTEGIAALFVDRSGSLAAEDIHMDIRFQNIKLNFENLGGMAFLFQGIVNSVGNVLFDGIKPFILNELNTRLLAAINENIKKIPQRFPNSIPPLDMAIAVFRGDIRTRGYDPFHVENAIQEWGGASVSMNNIWVTGLASFYRVGEVSLGVINNDANATFQLGTQRIEGQCNWEVSAGWLSRSGSASFWVDYAQATVSILQTLNVQRGPRIDKLKLKIGNIQTSVDGAGTLDYIAEFMLNVLPNVLRYQLVALAEDPLRKRVQDRLNLINVEELILEHLQQLEGTKTDEAKEDEEVAPSPPPPSRQEFEEYDYVERNVTEDYSD